MLSFRLADFGKRDFGNGQKYFVWINPILSRLQDLLHFTLFLEGFCSFQQYFLVLKSYLDDQWGTDDYFEENEGNYDDDDDDEVAGDGSDRE